MDHIARSISFGSAGRKPNGSGRWGRGMEKRRIMVSPPATSQRTTRPTRTGAPEAPAGLLEWTSGDLPLSRRIRVGVLVRGSDTPVQDSRKIRCSAHQPVRLVAKLELHNPQWIKMGTTSD